MPYYQNTPDRDTFDALNALVGLNVPMGPYTVETLPIPTAVLLGRTATVSNLFGTRYGRVRCEREGSSFYFWMPMSSDSAATSVINTNMTIKPLLTPSGVFFTGNIPLGITREVNLSIDGGWPGCIKEFRFDGVLSGGLNIIGTGLGSAVSMATGASKRFMLDFSTGALQWKQI